MATFEARMKVTCTMSVMVEADSAEEALAKIKSGQWSDELIKERRDWDIVGKVKEIE